MTDFAPQATYAGKRKAYEQSATLLGARRKAKDKPKSKKQKTLMG